MFPVSLRFEFCGVIERGEIEGIEDIDEYRFLEHGKKVKFIPVDASPFSVDTKDSSKKSSQYFKIFSKIETSKSLAALIQSVLAGGLQT